MSKEQSQVVERAVKGEKGALEPLVMEVKNPFYNLALKVLLFPENA